VIASLSRSSDGELSAHMETNCGMGKKGISRKIARDFRQKNCQKFTEEAKRVEFEKRVQEKFNRFACNERAKQAKSSKVE
jgi:hypothetical protein